MKDKISGEYDPRIMKRLLGYLKPYRRLIAAASAALVAVTMSELLVPVLIQNSVDSHIMTGSPSAEAITRDSLMLLVLLGVGLAASFVQVYLMSMAGQGIMKTIRLQLLGHTAGQSLSFFGKHPVGSLMTRITNDVETISEFFSSVVMTLIKNFLVMAGVIAVLFYLDPRLALATILTLPPVIVITFVFRTRARAAYRRVRESMSGLNAFLSERIAGMKIVQILAQEQRTSSEFSRKNGDLLSANISEMHVFAVFRPLISFLGTVSLAVVIYFGAGLYRDGIITLGVLIAYLDLVGKFYRPLQQLSEQFTIMQSAFAGAERIFDLLETEDRIPEYGRVKNSSAVFSSGSGSSPAVAFRDVRFSYKEDDPVLKGISFTAERGDRLAIAGYTGSGKTTIANLAARFWDADSGAIEVFGTDIRKIPLKQLRESVQTVQQDVFLFSGTIRENICMGRELSDRELEAAAETACLMPVIRELDKGFDHVLTESGTNLSGGQRQLIAFARIIAQDPPVLILDEATASIDTETEKLIQEGLNNLLKGRTALIIAHRLSTIRGADRILVLSGGKIAETGTHEQLLAAGGLYSSLYRYQFGSS